MRRRSKMSIEPKYILLLCAVVCVILIVVSFRYKEKLEPVKTAVGDVISPMQRGINSVGTWISDRLNTLTSMKELAAENELLKKQLETVSNENKMLQLEKYDLENLRELYKLDQKYPDYPKVAANVIGKDPGNWYHNFTIDKGSEDGILLDMNVMAGNGLVGIVTEVGKNWSSVRAVIDDKSSVTGMFLKTSDTCIVSGNLKLGSTLEVSTIKKEANIKDGYEVVTSPVSSKFLPGILIGYVNNITVDSSNLTKSAQLTPAVNFDRLDAVLIITQLKEQKE